MARLRINKKTDTDLNKWEREMIHIIATDDEKDISLSREKGMGYDYVLDTYMMTVSTDRQIEVANKVFSNNLNNIILTLLYFVDPPRLTPETKSFFREMSNEFVELSKELDTLKTPNIYTYAKDLSTV